MAVSSREKSLKIIKIEKIKNLHICLQKLLCTKWMVPEKNEIFCNQAI